MPKMDDIKILLDKAKLDILCLNETFLTPNTPDNALSISGYSFFRNDRGLDVNKCGGGGVLVYVKDNRNVVPLPGGYFSNAHIESCWLKLELLHAKPVIICSFYRPPDSNINDSLKELERQLSLLDVNMFNFDLLLLGDMNVDLSKSNSTERHLRSFLSEFDLTN